MPVLRRHRAKGERAGKGLNGGACAERRRRSRRLESGAAALTERRTGPLSGHKGRAAGRRRTEAEHDRRYAGCGHMTAPAYL